MQRLWGCLTTCAAQFCKGTHEPKAKLKTYQCVHALKSFVGGGFFFLKGLVLVGILLSHLERYSTFSRLISDGEHRCISMRIPTAEALLCLLQPDTYRTGSARCPAVDTGQTSPVLAWFTSNPFSTHNLLTLPPSGPHFGTIHSSFAGSRVS